jgi:pimeloyl-ACP methyl ester carboxylesterase
MKSNGRQDFRRQALVAFAAVAMIGAAAQPERNLAVDAVRDTTYHVVVAEHETIAVHDVGVGEPVVIVPGMLGSAFGFRHVSRGLVEAGRRVIVIDPLGTGSSSMPERADYSLTAQADRITTVMDSIGVVSAPLVCHSVSGSMCLRAAYRSPSRVSGVVSINGGPAERAASDGLRFALRFGGVVRLFTGDGFIRGKVRDGLVSASADPAWVTDEVLEGYLAHYDGELDRVMHSLGRMASASEPEPLASNLSRIQAPVLLLLGDSVGDGGVPADEMARLVEHVPALRVPPRPNCRGHAQNCGWHCRRSREHGRHD